MRFVLALLFLVRLAHADVGVVVSGDPNLQARVLDVAQQWLQNKNQTLVAAPLGDASTTLIDCFVIEDMACARKVFDEKSKASTVVFIRVDMAASGSRDYQLGAYWFARGAEPVGEKRMCANCDDNALQATMGDLMTVLATKGARGMGHLTIAGGANLTVKVDGTELATMPVDKELSAGSHELVFLHRGAPVEVRRIDVAAGAVVELQAPHLSDQQPRPSRGRSKLVPALLMVGGVAAAAAGGALLYYGSLRGPDEPYEYKNATEIGLPLALVGAFAIGASTALFIAGSGSDASVGVSGSF